jgi:hypothetical protein
MRWLGWTQSHELGTTLMRLLGVTIMLLVASVPLLNYPDRPRRLIGAAAILVAFVMIRSVWTMQARHHAELMQKLDAVARAVRRPRISKRIEGSLPAGPGEDSPITDLAATQAALLLDKLRREHKQRRHG